MNTLTDEVLVQLLEETATSYDVPQRGPDEILAAIEAEPARPPVLQRRWVQLSAAAALLVGGLVFLTAQTGGGGGGQIASNQSATSDAKAAPPAAADVQRRALSLAPNIRPQADLAAPVPAAPGAVSGGSAGGVGGGAAGSAPGPAVQAPAVNAPPVDGGDSRVVKTGSISLVVGDKKVSSTLTAVQRAAKAQGGYIAASTSDEYGDTPSGEVTIRVPVDRFENLVAAVRGLNAKVRTASTSGKDVTAEYADLDAQLRTLKATRERFLLILTKANTIGEILTVQQRVDGVTGQIDRIEGQRKLLASQSDLSTLTVSVSEEGDPIVKATAKPRSGLSQAFHDGWDGFVTGVEGIIRHSGRVLLFLICVVVVLASGRSGWRLARRRMV